MGACKRKHCVLVPADGHIIACNVTGICCNNSACVLLMAGITNEASPACIIIAPTTRIKNAAIAFPSLLLAGTISFTIVACLARVMR